MKKVFVYRNLHKKCWSVKDWKTKKVIEHCQEISLHNAEFKVSEAGRTRVNNEKRKNVHAGVLGWIHSDRDEHSHLRNLVTYNPYTHKYFKLASWDKAVHNADKVYMNNGKVYI